MPRRPTDFTPDAVRRREKRQLENRELARIRAGDQSVETDQDQEAALRIGDRILLDRRLLDGSLAR